MTRQRAESPPRGLTPLPSDLVRISIGGLHAVAPISSTMDEILSCAFCLGTQLCAMLQKARRSDWRAFLLSLYVDSDYGLPAGSALADAHALVKDGAWRKGRNMPEPVSGERVWHTTNPRSGEVVSALVVSRLGLNSLSCKAVLDGRPVRSRLHDGVVYRATGGLGDGAFGSVFEYTAHDERTGQPLSEPPLSAAEESSSGLPLRFAGKFCIAEHAAGRDDTPWTERSVMKVLERRAEALDRRLDRRFSLPFPAQHAGSDAAVLASRLVHELALPPGPYTRPGFEQKLLFIAMEPATGALLNQKQAPRLSMALRLSWRDAANVARAAFEDVARYYEETGLVHVDIKAENFLWDERGAAGFLHIFACDFGSFGTIDPPRWGGACTYCSPAGEVPMRASWSLVAFQIGCGIGCLSCLPAGFDASPGPLLRGGPVLTLLGRLPPPSPPSQVAHLHAPCAAPGQGVHCHPLGAPRKARQGVLHQPPNAQPPAGRGLVAGAARPHRGAARVPEVPGPSRGL